MNFAGVRALLACVLILAAIDGAATYFVARSSPSTAASASTETSIVYPTGHPYLTAEGWVVRNLEALLRAGFGAKPPCVSMSGGPRHSYFAVRFTAGPSRGGCGPAANAVLYHYLLVGPSGTIFYPLGRYDMFKLGFGASHVLPVLLDGQGIACNASATRFLVEYVDDVPLALGCLKPVTEPAAPPLNFGRVPVVLGSRPYYLRLTQEGRLLWNLEALLRRSFPRPGGPLCSTNFDTRTSWNFSPNNQLGWCLPAPRYEAYALMFARPVRPPRFHLDGFEIPGKVVKADTDGEQPVLIRGRLIACGRKPGRYLFSPALRRAYYLELHCLPGSIVRAKTPGLLASISGTDRVTTSPSFSAASFTVDWSHQCPGSLSPGSGRLRIKAWQVGARRQSRAPVATLRKLVGTMRTPSGDSNGETSFDSGGAIQLRVRSTGGPPCHWHVWVLK